MGKNLASDKNGLSFFNRDRLFMLRNTNQHIG